ncbi:uncharacterized protein [Apostichopus japonicus]|uniref:uncharacterized protein n=1 Tax=Stichopus japonicus TaxID=307972 RepID=UPI003AB47A07
MHFPGKISTYVAAEVTGKFGNIDEDREETHVSLVDCLRQRCRRKRRKEVRKVGVEITDQYVCTPHTPLVAAVLPRKRRRCSSKLCGPIGNEHESGNLCMEIQWRTFCHTRYLTSQGSPSLADRLGRKRRHVDDNDDKAVTSRRDVTTSTTPLTLYLLPAKRRRCSPRQRQWRKYRDVRNRYAQSKVTKPVPAVLPMVVVEWWLKDPILKEDIYSFIHNIRLDITRSCQLAALFERKCII